MEEAPSRKTSPAVRQPRPQGRLVFQYDGGRREDPGTQQRSRDQFVHGEKNFIQNGSPSSFAKVGAFANRERSLFHSRYFENGSLEQGYFLKTLWNCYPPKFN